MKFNGQQESEGNGNAANEILTPSIKIICPFLVFAILLVPKQLYLNMKKSNIMLHLSSSFHIAR